MKGSARYIAKTGRVKYYLAALAVIAAMICHVGIRMYILSLENEVRWMRGRNAGMTAVIERDEVRLAELRKGARIKRIAREKLGMRMPEGAPEKLF